MLRARTAQAAADPGPTEALSLDERVEHTERYDARALARRATDAYLGELLGAGVEIFRFRGGFLHAKRLIADERVASVGTANFDYRSLEYNTEATALLLDSATVRQAIRRFDEDLASCTPIDPEAWRRRSVHYRLGDRIARLFAPLL